MYQVDASRAHIFSTKPMGNGELFRLDRELGRPYGTFHHIPAVVELPEDAAPCRRCGAKVSDEQDDENGGLCYGCATSII